MAQPPYRDIAVGDLLRRLACALPDRDAVVYVGGPRWTFAAFEAEARTIARGLLAVGVEPGERVVVWATNVPEWLVLQFALAKIGAVLVTANTSLRARDVEYLLRQSEAATLVTIRGFRDVDYIAELSSISVPASLKRKLFVGPNAPPGFMPFEQLRTAAPRVPDATLDACTAAVGPDDVINMQYTSGTTGFPKGVMLSSRNILNNGYACGEVLGYTAADRLCLCVPLFHCFGCVIGVMGAFTHGSCLCVVEAFDAKRVLETIHAERCTAVYGVPTMFIAELEHPDFAKYDLTSLRTGVMAGSLCPEPLMRRVMTDMHVPEITIAYGLTEASPVITMTPRSSTIAQRSQTVGVLLPEVEAKIIDPSTGASRATGERGELCTRGYHVMKGYYNNAEATGAAIDADGWLHTGDEASVDADGCFRITGRIKDLIIRGGENIAPKEVEDCLREHDAVADAYVYGVADEFFGEAVAAAVRPKREVPAEELIAWCAAALAKFKVPKYVRFVEDFPMTASGKIQKFKLRDEHQKLLGALLVLIAIIPSTLFAQTTNPAARAARTWRQQHERAIVDEMIGLVSMPNISRNRADIQKNADAIAAMMGKRGIAAKQVSVPGGNPIVVGEIQTPGASRTIAFYAHYDGQPLDPKEWASPPFEPVIRDKPVEDGGRAVPLPAAGTPFNPEWRLYARSASDDKAPIVAMLTAIDAVRAAGIRFKSDVKLVFEGEEEIGSPHLEATLAANRALFAADLWIMCDGPVYQTRQQSIIFGARGVSTFDVTVYGPRGELHSGHYGNWAPNPAMMLAKLLASMKDDNGRVVIPGFYDEVEPLGDLETRAINEAPAIDAQLMRDFWLGSTEGGPKTINELIALPSFNVRGMASARSGDQASNVIPATATATIDVRLVKGMSPERTQQRIRDFIEKQGFFVVSSEPTADVRRAHAKVAKVVFPRGAAASRTPMDLPIAQEIVRLVEDVRGRTVKLPTMGGGLPLADVERPLGTRTIVIPIANHDNSQHSYNENLRLQNLWDGIELLAALITM